MKASLMGELLLLVGLLAVAYLLYVQQGQLVELELELDRMRGAVGSHLPPVPVASENDAAPVPAAADRPGQQRRRKGASSG